MKAEVASVKREHIVEAAIRRFSHFGINKTTLGEIAEDIGISKPSLFYYFHDKSSLLEAVARKIINEFLNGFETGISSAKSVDEGLLSLIEVKRKFFKKYLLLAVQADNIELNKTSIEQTEVIVEAHRKTELLISGLLQRGIEQKVLRPLDTVKTSQLLLETLEAFEYSIKHKSRVLESNDIDVLFNKEKEVVKILLNGLKSSEWKN